MLTGASDIVGMAASDGEGGNKAPIKPVDAVVALYDFMGDRRTQLSFGLGDVIYIYTKDDSGWLDGVLMLPSGGYARGWVPCTYVRSVYYLEPSNTKLDSTNQVDTSTAANTAANVLLPTFAGLLQKNTQEYRKETSADATRKSSLVSFASSEGSDVKGNDVKGKPTSSTPTSRRNSNTRTNSSLESLNDYIVDVERAEKMIEEYRQRTGKEVFCVTKPTVSGDILCYIEELDIYTSSPPLTVYDKETSNRRNVDLFSSSELEEPHFVDINTDSSVLNDFSQDFISEELVKNISGKLNLDSDASALLISKGSDYNAYHHFSKCLFAFDGLFYNYSEDIRTWQSLEETFHTNMHQCLRSLRERDIRIFGYYYEKLSNVILKIVKSTKLLRADFIGSAYESSIRGKLKKIIYLNAQMYVNSILQFDVLEGGHDSESREKESQEQGSCPLAPIDLGESFSSPDARKEGLVLSQTVSSLIKILSHISKAKKVKRSDYDVPEDEDDEQDRSDFLPQIYPRFVCDDFNGGNWCNPFLGISESVFNASGELLKLKSRSKKVIDRTSVDSITSYCNELKALSEDMKEALFSVPHMDDTQRNARNDSMSRQMYRYLKSASALCDQLESLDFTIFYLMDRYNQSGNKLKNFSSNKINESSADALRVDSKVVVDFFELKQLYHTSLSNVIMAVQSLSIDDPEVFKTIEDENFDLDIPRDDAEKEAYDLYRLIISQNSKGENLAIMVDRDKVLEEDLQALVKLLDLISSSLWYLMEERESILNFATRILHSDFGMHLLLTERKNTIYSDKQDMVTFYPDHSSGGIPWYLEIDANNELLVDLSGNVKGGTKRALVAYLCQQSNNNSDFATIFLITFAGFMKIDELIGLMIEQFKRDAPVGLSFEEYNIWVAKKQNPTRVRVLELMKLLIEKCWVNSYYQEPVLRKWLAFIQLPLVKKSPLSRAISHKLQHLLANGRPSDKTKLGSTVSSISSTKGLHSSIKKMRLFDIDPTEMANQLTFIDSSIFQKISIYACLTKVWGQKGFLRENIDSITEIIKNSNQLTNFVTFMILRKPELKKRSQTIAYFIKVAERCRTLNNFSSMTAIISGLYSSSIHRLKKTWEVTDPTLSRSLQNMNKLMNSARNFSEYRNILRFLGPEPCVPFFGVILSDLTFVFHGNPNFLLSKGLYINFYKQAKTYDIVKDITRLKSIPYNIQENPEVQGFLNLWFDKSPNFEEQYRMSLHLEPRHPKSSSRRHPLEKLSRSKH